MTYKDAFSPDDWQRIRSTPWIVAIAVIAADPSGSMKTGREIGALRSMVAETDAHGSPNDLIRAVADDIVADRTSDEPSVPGTLRGHDSLREAAIDHCRTIVEILDGVAEPTEAEQFRAWLLGLAHGVAAAAKEGGFLGLGGTDVSDAERATLEDLAEVLAVER